MTATPEAARARRYLLGQATEEESSVIEQEYLEHDEAVERIAAVEDDLIEEYLTNQLSSSERQHFERTYLAAPPHRVRVETVRRLMAHSARTGSAGNEKRSLASWTRMSSHSGWLALAATILVVASIALWRFSSVESQPPQVTEVPPPAETPQTTPVVPPSAPRVFAVTLSPVAVRSAADSPSVVVPSGTDLIVLRFQADVDPRKLAPRRASIQTIAGVEQWQGPAVTESNPSQGTVARVEVPAANLAPDDYTVILYGTDQAGLEREWTRYFLPIRAR